MAALKDRLSWLYIQDLKLGNSVIYEGQALTERDSNPTVNSVVVSEDYFRVMGIRLLVGRPFDQHDTASGTPTVIISESLSAVCLARRHA